MEAAICSSSKKDDTILNISNGKFGERFNLISKIYSNTINLSYDWGKSIDVDDVKSIIDNHKIDIITMVHNETSTGILNPIDEIGKLAKENNILFVVDMITSFGGELIDVEKSNIDIAISASQKSISSVPGLSIISTSDYAILKMKRIKRRSYYLDLLKYKNSTENYIKSTPYTPALSSFYALYKSLVNIKEYGINKYIEKHKIYSNSIRIGIKNMNLELFPKLNKWSNYSNTLTVIKSPKEIDSTYIKSEMEKRNIIISTGHDHIKNKVFRIGNMGNITFSDIIITLLQLESIMYNNKITNDFGISTKKVLDFINPYYEKY